MISLSRLLQKLPADCLTMAVGIHFKSVYTNTTFNINSLSFYNNNSYYYKSNDDENPRRK